MRIGDDMSDPVLLLRTIPPSRISHKGFQWPESGPVKAPEWDDTPCECKGLLGLPWGTGDGSFLSDESDAIWLVLETRKDLLVDLEGVVKTPRAQVVYSGNREGALRFLKESGRPSTTLVYDTAKAGSFDVAGTGKGGTSHAGNYGCAYSGHSGCSVSLEGGISVTRGAGTATSGFDGHSVATGSNGTALTEGLGTAIVGPSGKAVSGSYGKSIAGRFGIAITGPYGLAISEEGYVQAGHGGHICIEWIGCVGPDYQQGRQSVSGVIGVGGLKPNILYKRDGDSFIPVSPEDLLNGRASQ